MKLVAYLGPSFGAREARRLAPGVKLLPPAARGDVFRALRRDCPGAIALLDGVFEARPAVWHREILAALEEGVAVFGAASMGALRAAELWPFGMVGIGQVYRWFRDGTLVDDSEVALLHADREHGYRPFTVPLVNARVAAERARRAQILSRGQARAVVDAAAALFYQERTWPRLLSAVGFSAPVRGAFEQLLATERPDVKAEDARACLVAAAEFARRDVAPVVARPLWPPASRLVRGRLGAAGQAGERSLLAAMARSFGVRVTAIELLALPGRFRSLREREEAALAAWARRHGHQMFPGLDPV